MEPDFWHKKWESNQIGFHADEVNPLLVNSFQALSLSKGMRIFLPLCGKTLDIAWLLNEGYRVVGVELNPSAVEQLFAELGVEANIQVLDKFSCYSAENIDIYLGDFFDLTGEMLGPVDAIYDRAALVALPEDMRCDYRQHLMSITGEASQLLITYEYEQEKIPGPPFSVSEQEVFQAYQDIYAIRLLDEQDVPGGFKGVCPAQEKVWLLTRG